MEVEGERTEEEEGEDVENNAGSLKDGGHGEDGVRELGSRLRNIGMDMSSGTEGSQVSLQISGQRRLCRR